ncbi:MAG: hypothetical protein KBG28_00805, partial [Kofleriaceae bacterium]|nr:hypothetical protein [Kofleriaceae bacterium]
MPSHSVESLTQSHNLVAATESQLELVADEDIRGCVDEAMVFEGDLTLEGDLDLNSGAVLI